MLLSVIIPVYNEKSTIETVIQNVLAFKDLEKEILIVDDCSTDGTNEIIEKIKEQNHKNIKFFRHTENLGKGAAIRTALNAIYSDIVLIQDADLEYNPKDFKKLLTPILENKADVVYGSRFLGGGPSRVHLFWNYTANRLLTLLANILTNMNFSDVETGYKVFKTPVIKSIDLEENSFGFEPEITVKLSKKKLVFYEVPVSYYGRTYLEGKKIRLKDAFIAAYCLIKYFIFAK